MFYVVSYFDSVQHLTDHFDPLVLDPDYPRLGRIHSRRDEYIVGNDEEEGAHANKRRPADVEPESEKDEN